jgi:hypothetical protein
LARGADGAVAFVASLLPARFLVDGAAELGITDIIVGSRTHERCYAYVADRLTGVRVSRLNEGRIAATLSLAWRLAAAKWRGRPVIFFHECCWPEFDLLVTLLRPVGRFYPQVSMAGLQAVGLAEWAPATTWAGRLKRLAFKPVQGRFRLYRSPKLSGASGDDYFLSIRDYPPTIATFRPDSASTPGLPSRTGQAPSRRVLFVVGLESVPDGYLRQLYLALIQAAQQSGLAVSIKDHPIYRLDIPCESCEHIDSAMPAELVTGDFAFVIGIASTGLLAVKGRKISCLRILEPMSDAIKRMRMNHLLSLPGGDQVEFPATLDEIKQVFHEHERAS